MAIALGGRWGRSDSEVAAEYAESDGNEEESATESESDEPAEAEVVEPSEVRDESDPWKD